MNEIYVHHANEHLRQEALISHDYYINHCYFGLYGYDPQIRNLLLFKPKIERKESNCFLFIFYSFIFIILRNSFKIQNL